jgi:nitrate/nitrite-specific signal transduction histidine kinase
MIFKKEGFKLKRKRPHFTIFIKLLLVFTLCTVIPVIVSGTLIALTYQEAIEKDFNIGLEQISIQIILSIVIIIVLVLFGIILVSRELTRPLKTLLKATKEIAKGNLDINIKVESKDELGELTDYFNKMTVQLKETEQEVDKKTDELKKRIEELENFYDLTVGRELKLLKLKEKIKKMEKGEKGNKI